MGSQRISYSRELHPGWSDYQLAEDLSSIDPRNCGIIVRYKASAGGEYNTFGLCGHEEMLLAYFTSRNCFDTEILYVHPDVRLNKIPYGLRITSEAPIDSPVFKLKQRDKEEQIVEEESYKIGEPEEEINKVFRSDLIKPLTNETFLNKVCNYETNEEWKFKGNKPCVICFYADWCEPAKIVEPILEELAREYEEKIDFYKINTDEEKELASVLGMKGIPSLLLVPTLGQPKKALGALSKETFLKSFKDILGVETRQSKEEKPKAGETSDRIIRPRERRELEKGTRTLGVYLEIDKLDNLTQKYNTVSYGFVGWRIIWNSVNIQKLKGITYLFDGDTNKTLNGYERVWCAAFQSDNEENLSFIKSSLEKNTEFIEVAASEKFKENNLVTKEPLPGSGCITLNGIWEGKTEFDSYSALVSMRKHEDKNRAKVDDKKAISNQKKEGEAKRTKKTLYINPLLPMDESITGIRIVNDTLKASPVIELNRIDTEKRMGEDGNRNIKGGKQNIEKQRIAQAGAKYWWKTGMAPLRAAPKKGMKVLLKREIFKLGRISFDKILPYFAFCLFLICLTFIQLSSRIESSGWQKFLLAIAYPSGIFLMSALLSLVVTKISEILLKSYSKIYWRFFIIGVIISLLVLFIGVVFFSDLQIDNLGWRRVFTFFKWSLGFSIFFLFVNLRDMQKEGKL